MFPGWGTQTWGANGWGDVTAAKFSLTGLSATASSWYFRSSRSRLWD